jgi:hypothetical protein
VHRGVFVAESERLVGEDAFGEADYGAAEAEGFILPFFFHHKLSAVKVVGKNHETSAHT